MGNCFHCYKDIEYAEHIEKNEIEKNEIEKNEKIEFDNIPKSDIKSSPKIEFDRTHSVDINIILNEIIDKYNEEHPKPEKKDKEKEPEIVFTVKRMNCRINI
jgi:hypothetical protein